MSKEISNEFITRERPGKSNTGTGSRPAILMSCEHMSLQPKTSKTVSSAYEWGKTVPNGGGDEDCVDSRSDV